MLCHTEKIAPGTVVIARLLNEVTARLVASPEFCIPISTESATSPFERYVITLLDVPPGENNFKIFEFKCKSHSEHYDHQKVIYP